MATRITPADELAAHAADLLESASPGAECERRRMFSGVGLFDGDAMFAVAIGENFYFKVDEGNAAAYDELELEALTFTRGSREIAMSFRQPPDEALDRSDTFLTWYGSALAAARRAAAKRKPKSQRKTKSGKKSAKVAARTKRVTKKKTSRKKKSSTRVVKNKTSRKTARKRSVAKKAKNR